MMKQQLPNPRRRGIETLIHIIVWGIVIGFPFLMMTRSGFNISLADYLRHGSSSTLSFFLVFYIRKELKVVIVPFLPQCFHTFFLNLS